MRQNRLTKFPLFSLLRYFKREEWDSLCKQCGLCCYEKMYMGGEYIIDMKSPCRYLDPATHLCTVYNERFEVCKECRKLTIFHALFSSYLPDTCGYVETFRFWKRFKGKHKS